MLCVVPAASGLALRSSDLIGTQGGHPNHKLLTKEDVSLKLRVCPHLHMRLSTSCPLLTALALTVQCHFVELDPWVVTNVLQPNIDNCDFNSESVIHTQKVEAFFDRAEEPGVLLVNTVLGSCLTSAAGKVTAVMYARGYNWKHRETLL